MYKVGDKLQCIKSAIYTDKPKINEVYTIIEVDDSDKRNIRYKINDDGSFFHENSIFNRYHLVLLKEYRKQKLNKINCK